MFTHKEITLKPLENIDVKAIAELANNRKVSDNLRDVFPHPYTLKDAEYFVNLVKNNTHGLDLGIHYKENFCGIIGLHPQSDVYKKSAEIGYWLGEAFWGKGIATSAVKLITLHGMNEMGLKRIFTGVFSHNLASMKVLEKNGYKMEGIFSKAVFKNGVFLDEHRYAFVVE